MISTATDIMLAFPALILALAIVAFRGRSAQNVIIALSILSIAPLTRIVRANTLVYSEREFVLAARSLGAKNSRVLFREILPNVVPSMVSFALTGLAVLIVAEGALAFLGQSVQPPDPDVGQAHRRGPPEPGRRLVDLADASGGDVPHDPGLQPPRRRVRQALRHPGEPPVTDCAGRQGGHARTTARSLEVDDLRT